MARRGRFITLEGIDGAGKSSHLDFLRERIGARGVEVLVTREPGGTPFGQALREVILHHPATPLAEAIAMFADRSAHVETLIEPSLAAGRWVLCDRFSDSTYAYQCGGRGLARDAVAALERIVHPHLQPDATFLFDLDPALAARRQRERAAAADKFEREQEDFFRRVREAYLERARAHPRRIHVIDAAATVEQVRERLAAALEKAFA
ncbi:MAG TPA: dTMP kinase [Usitatibacter sp.]|nr:dTMP kinase [Usitatibacter sp.]